VQRPRQSSMTPMGFEHPANLSGNSACTSAGGAKSGSLEPPENGAGGLPPDMVNAWLAFCPVALSDDQRRALSANLLAFHRGRGR
jgi:hypothetical protein